MESNVVAGMCGTVSCAVLISAARVNGNLASEVIAIASGMVVFRNSIDQDLAGFSGQLFIESQAVVVPSFYGVFATSLSTGKLYGTFPRTK